MDLPDLNRMIANECIGAGWIPEYGVLMVFFTGDITLCVKAEDGELVLEVQAPELQ